MRNVENDSFDMVRTLAGRIAMCLCVVLSAVLPARGEQGIEQARNIENLSNNSILSILQDRKGYIWMGSYDGLNRYDGKHVDVFRFELNTPQALSGNIISELFDAGGDDLWVLTTMGLDRFSTERLQAVAHYPEIRGDRHLMASDSLGNAFVHYPDGSLAYYDPGTKDFVQVDMPDLPRRRDVVQLLLEPGNTLWMFTSGCDIIKVKFDFSAGYTRDKARLHWQNVSVHDVPTSVVFKGDDGFFMLDADNDLHYYNWGARQRTFVANLDGVWQKYGKIVDVASFDGDIFIAFTGVGIGKLYGAENYRFELISDEVGVFRVLRDRHQPLLWCATDGRGLYKVYDIHTRYNTIRSSQIPSLAKPIRTFYSDMDNNLWIGTKGDGLIMVSDYVSHGHGHAIPAGSIRHFGSADGLPDNQVFSIKDSRFHAGRVWIATRGPGISYALMPQARIVSLAHEDIVDVHDIYEQNDSVLWLASTTKGLVRAVIERGSHGEVVKSVETFKFNKGVHVCAEIYSMAFDGRNSLYIGCRGGLGIVRFNIYTRTYDFLNNVTEAIPSIGDIICLYFAPDSMLYFGSSAGAGIMDCSNPDAPAITRVLTQRDGMVNDMTHVILPDGNGNVWISTNKGLVRFNPQTDAVHNITGLNGDIREFCDNSGYISPYNGHLIFGALNGIVWVSSDAGAHTSRPLPPLFSFNSLIINGYKRNINDWLSSDGTLTLASDQNTVGISFNALDYINGDDINYYYRLEGYTDEWVNLGTDPTVTFTNLPPGHYTLQVRYQSDSIDAPAAEYELPLYVKSPWYASAGAYCIYGVAVLLLIVGGVMRWRRVDARKRREMARNLYEQQQEQLYADRTEFFTNITHELCSPLTMILGLCNILRKDLNEDERKKLEHYIDSLQSHSQHLNELVQEILDFRKMEEGGFRNLRVQPVRMGYVFDRWVNSYAEIARDNDIEFRTSVDPPDLRWNTDTSCIGKIVTNLTSNAFKYTPVGGRIDISARIDDDGTVVLSVYNTGSGISPDDQKTLFNRYTVFRNMDQNGYREMASRHGLGLYICHELVERLGGEITVDSKEGEYTRFDVKLPPLEVTRKPLVAAGESGHDDLFESSGKPEVLVVDDNPDILWLVSDILSDQYNVAKAGSADEAFSMINRKVPALIITDIMMPDTDGIEFIAQLRQHKFAKNLPILILTAKVSETDKISGYNIGADAYVTKPFTPEYLKVIVERLLQRRKSDKDYYHSSESAVTLQDGIEISNEEKEFFDRIRQIIADNIEDESKLRPADLAREVGVDVRTLYRKFKKYTPYTPNEFVKNYRYSYAAKLLLTTNLTIQEIIYRVGLTNKTVFYADFKKIYGMTPKEYRDAG